MLHAKLTNFEQLFLDEMSAAHNDHDREQVLIGLLVEVLELKEDTNIWIVMDKLLLWESEVDKNKKDCCIVSSAGVEYALIQAKDICFFCGHEMHSTPFLALHYILNHR
jgi:hypothetical protein